MRSNLVKTLAGAAIAMLAGMPSASAALIGHWTLDNDTTGLQNMGTNGATSDLVAPAASASISGGPTFNATGGALNGYASFNGNQALVNQSVGNVADALTDYPFTFAAWIRPAAHSTTPTLRGAAVSISNSAAASTYFTLGVETPNEGADVQAVRRFTTFTSTEGVGTSSTVNDGNWHHLAVVNTSSTNSLLYLDGNQVGQSVVLVNYPTTFNTLAIGAFLRSAGYIDKYYGDIDDVRIYDSALSPEQVRALVPEPVTLGMAAIAICFGAVLHRVRRRAS